MLSKAALRVIPIVTAMLGASSAAAQTTIPGGTIGDSTWTAAGSPYRVSGRIIVARGATLTIGPGVTVEFADGLTVEGTISAVGTAAAPILLTGTSPEPGAWNGLTIRGTSDRINTGSRLVHVRIRYGGYDGANVMLSWAHAVIADCEISQSSSDGVRGYAEGSADVHTTRLAENRGYALRFDDASRAPSLSSLTAERNGFDRIAFGGGTTGGVRVFEKVLPYDLLGTIAVPAGGEVVFSPGVEVRLSYGLKVGGRITAIGTEAEPIFFTSKDAEPGSWNGIAIEGVENARNEGSILEHVVLEHGGYDGANLMLTHARATVAHTIVRGSSGDGIRGYAGGTADVTDTSFTDNAGYAVRFYDPSHAPLLSNLSTSNNGQDRIAFGGGTFGGDRVFENVLPYDFLGPIRAPAASEVRFSPGVEVRFSYGFAVEGKILALGSASEPIRFTAESALPGAWNGLSLQGSDMQRNEGSIFRHVIFEYGGYDGANLMLTEAQAKIEDSVFRSSMGDGIHGYAGADADVTRTRFVDNASYALRFDDARYDPKLHAVEATGNGIDAIAIGGGTTNGVRVFGSELPYELLRAIEVPRGAEVVIEPGAIVRLRYDLEIEGTIRSVGTKAKPILFTGLDPWPGSWNGITIRGREGARNQGSRLEHTTIELGGYAGANLMLADANVHLSNCIIAKSMTDGVRAVRAGGTLIEQTSFLENGGDDAFAVRNDSAQSDPEPIYAINDWWGSPEGPRTSDTCAPSGSGARVSEGVLYRPFLESTDTDLGPTPPLPDFNLSLEPLRWYVPADGQSRAHFMVTLRNAVGEPIQGRAVTLDSSVGQVTGGGLTDIEGKSFAFVTSDSPGEATVSAALEAVGACEPYRPATNTVSFTARDDNPLMPDAAAPYLASIEVSPEPLVQGVPAILRASLTNPNPFPISVDAEFGYARFGIGLAFGPIAIVSGQIIPSMSEGVVEGRFTPLISGHYCIQLLYTYQPAGSALSPARSLTFGSAGGGTAQQNFDTNPGCLRNPRQQDSIDKANKVLHGAHLGTTVGLNGVELLGHGHHPSPFWIPEILAGYIPTWALEKARIATDALQGCGSGGAESGSSGNLTSAGPVHREIPRARQIAFPLVVAGNQISAARSDAYNAWIRSALDAFMNLEAASEAEVRNQEAARAGDLEWSSQQAAAYLFFQKRAGIELVRLADATDTLLQVMRDEGISSVVISADAWSEYLDELEASGFSAVDLEAAHLLGISDEAIESYRRKLLTLAPIDLAGDRMVALAELGSVWRELGEALQMPPPLQEPSLSIGGSAGLSHTAKGNLARIYESRSEIVVGNPTNERETIELSARRIELPPDWSIELVPDRIQLEPAASSTVSVHLVPGSPVPQGTAPRIAIEARARGELLGGVVIDTLVPRYVEVDPSCAGIGARAEDESCACTMDCDLGLACAAQEGGERQCRRSCDLGAPSCPNGETCVASSGPDAICAVLPEEVDEGCGCTAADRRSNPLTLLLLLFLARSRRMVNLAAWRPRLRPSVPSKR